MKNGRILLTVLGGIVLSAAAALAGGNGAPSGSHYNLNIIGVKKGADWNAAAMDGTNGHSLFVPLWGNAKINLCDSDACADGGFEVLDRNGTDADGALFALPSPDPDDNGTTDYSVFARALGKPGGHADMTTCATDTQGTADPSDDELVCSDITLTLDNTTRPNKFQNVSKYLLFVFADLDGDGDLDRVPLFGDGFESFYWDYDNYGLKLAQLRFYPCNTTVTDPEPGSNFIGQTDNCFN